MKPFISSSHQLMKITLWVVASILFIPFALAWRFNPYMEFYQDIILVLLIAIASLTIVLAKKIPKQIPILSVFLLILGFYWCIQGFILDLPYKSQSIRVALFFVVLSMLSLTVQSLIAYFGREKVVVWIMYAVTIGGIFHAIVVVMQIVGWAAYFPQLLFSRPDSVDGQFGQRNILGHYLMWSILATTYLFSGGYLKKYCGIVILLFLGLVLGAVSSRTIILYLVLLFCLFVLIRFCFRSKNMQFIRYYLATLILVFIAQWSIPSLLEILGFPLQSGLDRLQEHFLTGRSSGIRLEEWQKAWQIFIENPVIGTGWNTYTFHGLMKDIDVVPDTVYHVTSVTHHCHNSILQILSEMGVAGLLLILGGVLFSVVSMLKNSHNNSYVVILGIIAVTTIHSMLEYPLWYSYFLAGFVIFLSLGQPITDKGICIKTHKNFSAILTSFSLAALITCTFLLLSNQLFINKWMRLEQGTMTARANAIADVGKIFPMFSDYGDLWELSDVDPTASVIDDDTVAVVTKSIKTKPNPSLANVHGLYLYRQNKIKESREWLKHSWHKYPQVVPKSMKMIYENSPMFKELEQPVYETCKRYRSLNLYPDVFNSECPMPPANKE